VGDSNRNSRLQSVDVLRALAALWVVFHHLPHSSRGLPPLVGRVLLLPADFGYLGVLLFLVLSGFCIHLGVARRMARGEEARADWFRFWKRRFWRLYPPYLAAIAFSLGMYYAVGPSAYPPEGRITSLPVDLATHLLLAQNLFRDYHQGLGNGVFWTLGLEEQLYLLFTVYLCLRRHCPVRWVLPLVFAVSVGWRCGCGWLFGPNEWSPDLPTLGPAPLRLGRWMHWPFTFWFAWVLGALAAEAHTRATALPRWCRDGRFLLSCAAIGFLLNEPLVLKRLLPPERLSHLLGVPALTLQPYLGALSGLSDIAFALAAFALLGRWVHLEEKGRLGGRLVNILAPVGAMSYSLYLIHLPLIRWLDHVLMPGLTLVDFAFRVAVYVPLCLGCAALFFFLVERHFLQQPKQLPQTVPPSREGDGAAGRVPIARGRVTRRLCGRPS
jgi:peptidoglycan/LPS O-acetylase OafA/YrhL